MVLDPDPPSFMPDPFDAIVAQTISAYRLAEERKAHPNIDWRYCHESSWTPAIEHVKRMLDSSMHVCAVCKIGITSSPFFRWTGQPRNERCTVHPHRRDFSEMVVLYVNTGSSASSLEMHLVSMFGDHSKCDNLRAGGDGPISDIMCTYLVYSSLLENNDLVMEYRKRMIGKYGRPKVVKSKFAKASALGLSC